MRRIERNNPQQPLPSHITQEVQDWYSNLNPSMLLNLIKIEICDNVNNNYTSDPSILTMFDISECFGHDPMRIEQAAHEAGESL